MAYPTATVETTHGTLALELWDDVAPGHVANFQKLAADGFYDGLSFHRIISNFVIQGGCPNGDGTGGPGWNVDAEFNDREHVEGVLSMARSTDPNSAGSQFFICLGRDHCKHLDGSYTAFGRVTGGLDVVRAIGAIPVDGRDHPEEPAGMVSVKA
ncbi:MAG TPA: peptidylprolyl isomerase [Phycisphaerales bacterium]|nr:peptidylprolyl isomerase [Phycisphaerales bacterium]